MNKSIITAALVTMLLGGCSSMFNIDKPLTTCSTSDKGKPCVSARAAYYASQSYDPEANMAFPGEGRKSKRRGERDTVSPFAPQPIPLQNTAANGTGYPKPLLQPAKVMRVWINSYEDEDGNLVYPTRVYTEVGQKKWDTGYSLKRSGNKAKRVTPLVASPVEENLPKEADKSDEASAAKTAESVQNRTQSATADTQPVPNSLPQGVIPPLQ